MICIDIETKALVMLDFFRAKLILKFGIFKI